MLTYIQPNDDSASSKDGSNDVTDSAFFFLPMPVAGLTICPVEAMLTCNDKLAFQENWLIIGQAKDDLMLCPQTWLITRSPSAFVNLKNGFR
jgi:hypothetical protein